MLEKKQPLHKRCCELYIFACRRLKLNPYLSPCTKINSKWIKDLNVRLETLKLLKENRWKILVDISIGNIVLNRTTIARK
jgi:hypothetical protein